MGLVSFSVFGQGAITFGTFGGGVTALATNIVTGLPVSGNGYLAQLYYGAAGATEAQLVPCPLQNGTVPAPARFGASGPVLGYIVASTGGGTRYANAAVVAPGENTAFQIRAWDATLGADWDIAQAAWMSGPIGPGLGSSSIITTKTSATSSSATPPLTGMTSFTLRPVPEPSVIALGALGLAALLYRRRK